MTSERQIAANRRNAQRSTGPRTLRGKLQSRQNAFQHGLTAETIVASVEDAEEYRKLERGLICDFAPTTAFERVLVARLASLVWRARRATQIESGLFELEASRRIACQTQAKDPALDVFYRLLRSPSSVDPDKSIGGNIIASSERTIQNTTLASIYHRISTLIRT